MCPYKLKVLIFDLHDLGQEITVTLIDHTLALASCHAIAPACTR